jgi:hypothetical protein
MESPVKVKLTYFVNPSEFYFQFDGVFEREQRKNDKALSLKFEQEIRRISKDAKIVRTANVGDVS